MDANSGKPHEHGVAAEPDRVSTAVVVGLGVLLTGAAALAVVLVLALFRGLEKGAETKDRASIAAAGLERKQDAAPPPPRLQVYPAKHWADFRAAEANRLSTYGWMDRSTGAVHIPIDRAMDLVLERGVGPLPPAPMAMPQAPTPGPTPVTNP
jgi:hypothetical protein